MQHVNVCIRGRQSLHPWLRSTNQSYNRIFRTRVLRRMPAAAASALEKLHKSSDIANDEVGTDVFYRAEG